MTGADAGLSLVPAAATVDRVPGWWRLPDRLTIAHDPEAEDCAALLAQYLTVTGRGIEVTNTPAGGDIALRISPTHPEAGRHPGDPDDRLRAQGYGLDVDVTGVRLRAPSVDGLRNAVQTLRQLLPAEVYSPRAVADVDWRVPFVRITDAPRFAWRGSLLDVGRWHLPLDYLYRYVESLAVHKLNRLHLHLTDDQGWRFEVRRYPQLTGVGAWRAQSPAGHAREGRGDGVAHGGFYTQDELRQLVAFAARRGVVIVPEIDLPGHVTAALAAYPELGNTGQAVAVSTVWGVHEHVLNLEESTVQFCREVLDEVMAVFPGPWVHLGGDECPTTEWAATPRAVERARELGLGGVEQLQAWFLEQLCTHLRANGRTPVVWDEAFNDTLAPDAVVMAWRSEDAGFTAAAAGHHVVMAPQQWTYLDHYQEDPAQVADEPLAIGGLTRLSDVVGYDPLPADAGPSGGRTLDDDARARVLGTQGQLWTEYLPTPERVDDMAYPRLSALAEKAWSRVPTAAAHDDLLARLGLHTRRLELGGVRPRRLR